MSELLANKVVIVSGVGPGLGAALCRQIAIAGGSVVLAARTKERLDAIAHSLQSYGTPVMVVPTDINDDSAVEELMAATVERFGRIDAVVNNAFAMPSMKPLAKTDFQQIRDGIELTVLGTLRVTNAAVSELTKTKGSVVMINSMVVRHSDPRYGSYKIAKSALLAMSQTLATELGSNGIRVNSVLPGYIWDDQLETYFTMIAEKYGITSEQVYEQTAAKSDLKRLPEPDEIARAAVFLASDHASAITGQTLDINCGEYHF